MAGSVKGSRPTYLAFHAWLKANRRDIIAGRDKTVIYSGMTSGKEPVGKMLPKIASYIRADIGKHPGWTPIETVLRGMECKVNRHMEENIPPKLMKYRSMWEFGRECVNDQLLSKSEGQQVWKSLSAWYVKNARGHVWIIEGEKLKKYPDMIMTELAVLLKNDKLDKDTIKRVGSYIPNIEKKWEEYRADSKRDRMAGR